MRLVFIPQLGDKANIGIGFEHIGQVFDFLSGWFIQNPALARCWAVALVVAIVVTQIAARGDEEAEWDYPTSAEQVAQLGELVTTGVTDPNTYEDRLTGVGERNGFCNLGQRGHVDDDNVAVPG